MTTNSPIPSQLGPAMPRNSAASQIKTTEEAWPSAMPAGGIPSRPRFAAPVKTHAQIQEEVDSLSDAARLGASRAGPRVMRSATEAMSVQRASDRAGYDRRLDLIEHTLAEQGEVLARLPALAEAPLASALSADPGASAGAA
jgi:hypothetical protein